MGLQLVYAEQKLSNSKRFLIKSQLNLISPQERVNTEYHVLYEKSLEISPIVLYNPPDTRKLEKLMFMFMHFSI